MGYIAYRNIARSSSGTDIDCSKFKLSIGSKTSILNQTWNTFFITTEKI